MATVSTESELILRAKDLASQPIEKVITLSRELTNVLAEQAKAAELGKASQSSLTTALNESQRAYGALQAQIEKLNAAEKASADRDEKAAALAEARDRLAEARSRVADPAKPTKDEAAGVRALQTEVAQLERAYNRAESAVARSTTALARMGVTANTSAAEIARLREAIQAESSASLASIAQAANAQRNFNELRAQAAQAAKAKADAEKEAAAQEKRDIEAIAAALRAEDEAIIKLARDQAAQAAAAAEEAARQIDQAAKLAAFHAQAARAGGAVPGLSPVGESPGAVTGTNETAESLARILAPAAAARASLAGVTEEIKNVTAALEPADQEAKVYTAALNTLAASARELERQGSLIDSYKQQEAEVTKAASAVERDRAALNALRETALASRVVDDDLTAAIRRQESALQASTASYERANAALTKQRATLAAAKIDHTALAEAEKLLTAGASEVTSGIAKATEALAHGAEESHKSGGFLGFRPDQLHQVAYVLKDITDQLGAGASLGRALETQSGKAFEALYAGAGVAQKAFGSLLPLLPAIAAGISGIAAAGIVLNRAYADSEAIREFNAQLHATVDAGRATGPQLEGIARDIQHLGVSFDEAKAATQEFLESGLNPQKFVELARIAQNLADIYGIKFAEAVKQVSTAFAGNVDSIVKLNEKYDFLTKTTFDQIEALEKEGKTAEALAVAQDALRDRLDSVEGKTSSVTAATRQLSNNWNDLVEAFKNSAPIQFVIDTLGRLVGVLGAVVRGVNSAIGALGGGISSGTTSDQARQQLVGVQDQIDRTQGQITNLSHQDSPNVDALQHAADQLAFLQKQKDTLQQIAGVQTDSARTAVDITAQRESETRTLEKQAELHRELRGAAAAEADAATLAATRELERRKYTAEQLKDTQVLANIDAVVAERAEKIRAERARQPTADQVAGQLGSETAQLNARASGHTAEADELAVTADVEQKKEEIAKKLGITVADIDAKNSEDARKAYDALAAYKEAKEKELAAAREKRGEGAAKKAADATVAAENEVLAIKEKIAGFDKSNLEARLAGIDAEYAKYRNTLAQAASRGGNVAGLSGQLDDAEAKEKQQATTQFYEKAINDLLAARKTEYTAINEAVKDGSVSVADAFQKTSEVTSEFSPKISAMAKQAVEFAKAMAGANPSPQMQAFIAKMEAISTKTPLTDSRGAASGVATAALQPVVTLSRSRDEDIAAQKELEQEGLQSAATTQANIKAAYDATTEAIKTQIAAIRSALDAQLAAGEITRVDYDKTIAELTKLGAQANHVDEFTQDLQKTITGSFESGIVSTFDKITEAVGKFAAGHEKLQGVFKATEAAFGSFAASFLKNIADMIIKREAFNLVNGLFGGSGDSGGDNGGWTDTTGQDAPTTGSQYAGGDSGGGQTSSTSGGVGTLGGSLIKAGVSAVARYASTAIAALFHEGGVVGSGNMSRAVPVGLFTMAPRYHDGTVVGLGSDEQAAILQRGEEVLSKNDPRNKMNGGGSSAAASSPVAIRQVLAFNEKDLSAAMAGSHGEQVVLTHIKNNTGTVRTLLNR